ncbi:hypothetical protein NP493_3092g00000 [Ridgeia piscesae]|uniref:Uncharacterized protein n=1 Tax=Ridgeia piscesae TaxID=27915 RepID=A0AAD9MXE9_RIDPI|nr:hypothetical protein NP493_3092g00000 [Ridgeia piscesae]
MPSSRRSTRRRCRPRTLKTWLFTVALAFGQPTLVRSSSNSDISK